MLACTLIPLSILSVAVCAVMLRTLQRNATTTNYNLLAQFKSNIESSVNELDYMNVGISVNSTMMSLLRRTLTYEEFSITENQLRTTIKNFLIPLTVSRPYVKSLYLYMDNPYGRFVTDVDGLVTLDAYKDTSWYESYLENKDSGRTIWCEPRHYREYSFLNEDTEVVTLYKKFFVGKGVYILNISRPFFENEIAKLDIYPDQSILALNEENEVLFSNHDLNGLSQEDIHAIGSGDTQVLPSYEIEGRRYYIVRLLSEKYGWKYISVIPHASLYRSVFQLELLFFAAIATTTALCAVLAYLTVRRSFGSITRIVSLLEAAERDEPLPELGRAPDDVYGQIMQNIVRTYVRQSTLKRQLTEQKYEARMLELSALQAQISPHFLFNTLKSIFWMSFQLTGSKNDVSVMIEDMTDILHYSLSERDRLVALGDEIRNTRNYISIQQMRYNNRFEAVWRYEEAFGGVPVIKLLLQPLIENCIQHAFTWEEGERPRIRIRVARLGGAVEIRVTDNGCGIGPSELEGIRARLRAGEDGGHIGIYNVNRRLILTFGAGSGLSINSRPALGTCVRVRFPAGE